MGGRGSSSGMSDSGKKYGTEYTTLYQTGNIKYVSTNTGANKSPMETMTKGRVYVTVDNNTGELKYISYFDKHNKRYKQIDLLHFHKVNGVKTKPHTHKGYIHNEYGDSVPSKTEKKMIDRVTETWYNIKGK